MILTRLTDSIETALPDISKTYIYGLLVLSVATVVVSFMGCCGSAKESSCLLVTHGIVLFLLAIVTGVVVGVIMEFSHDFTGLVTQGIDQLEKHYDSDNPQARQAMDDIQSTLKCCGSRGMGGWDKYVESHNNTYPPSCCENKDHCVEENIYKTSCSHKVCELLSTGTQLISIVGISVAVVLLVSSISSCCLARSFSRKRNAIVVDPSRYYSRFTT